MWNSRFVSKTDECTLYNSLSNYTMEKLGRVSREHFELTFKLRCPWTILIFLHWFMWLSPSALLIFSYENLSTIKRRIVHYLLEERISALSYLKEIIFSNENFISTVWSNLLHSLLPSSSSSTKRRNESVIEEVRYDQHGSIGAQ